MTEDKPKSKRGFALMDPGKQREIARKDVKSVPDDLLANHQRCRERRA